MGTSSVHPLVGMPEEQCRKPVTAFLLNERSEQKWNLGWAERALVDLKDIKAIIDLMKKNSISEFELERQDFKIRLKRGGAGPAPAAIAAFEDSPISFAAPGTLPPTAAMAMAGATPAAAGAAEQEIKAPMIGTFYRAPSPEAGNYVEVGTEVNPDTVVCIIEAMKVMNEIKAELEGEVVEILPQNGEPVEFGQPLFVIR